MKFLPRIPPAALVLLLISARVAQSAMIINDLGNTPPKDAPGDVFDVSNAGNSYFLGPSTALDPKSDARDIFGATLSSVEPGDTLFADNQSIGTVETVFVTLAKAVSLSHYNLFLTEDGLPSGTNGHRTLREFKLFAGSTLIDDVTVLNSTGNQTYTGVYGGNGGGGITITDTLSAAPTSASYTLEFIQNQAANNTSGIRVIEFDGYAVPEPSGLALAAAAVLGVLGGLLTRRARRSRGGVAAPQDISTDQWLHNRHQEKVNVS